MLTCEHANANSHQKKPIQEVLQLIISNRIFPMLFVHFHDTLYENVLKRGIE